MKYRLSTVVPVVDKRTFCFAVPGPRGPLRNGAHYPSRLHHHVDPLKPETAVKLVCPPHIEGTFE